MFSAEDRHFLLYLHWVQHVLAFFGKLHEFVQNSVFSPRSACFVIFVLGIPLLNVFNKVHEFVQNSVFSPRSACFVIFALGPPICPKSKTVLLARDHHVLSFSHCAHYLLATFEQSARVCSEQRFLPMISMFCHFPTGAPLFSDFQQSA